MINRRVFPTFNAFPELNFPGLSGIKIKKQPNLKAHLQLLE